MSNTIVAVATPSGRGGIAVIRMSGENAHTALGDIFVSKSKLKHRLMTFGRVILDEFEDTCLAVIFDAPQSYTGESMAELHCHGSPSIVQAIVQKLIDNGCFLAGRGEFSRRAVLNGKMDLLQAEGTIDRIDASSLQQVIQSGYLLDGVLSKKIIALQTQSLECLASCEVVLDYPEEGLEEQTTMQLDAKLADLRASIEGMLDKFCQGRLIREGVKVALVGAPNTGKSSLLNAMLGFDRAIVDDVAGTTRDVIRDIYQYKGVQFVLSDTAGIRHTQDKIERQGVQRSRVEADNADVIICFDDNFAQDSRSVLVASKADLKGATEQNKNERLPISAVTLYNIDKLKDIVYNKSIGSSIETVAINNMRHYNALKSALQSIKLAQQGLHTTTLDCTSIDIKAAWIALKSLTGVAATDEILDTIFSRFCVGK